MPGDTHPRERSSSETADQRTKLGGIRDWIEVLAKILTPVAVIVAAIAGATIASSFQRQMSGATMLSQREQAESRLVASMFSSLIDPIIGLQKGEDISVDRERLLVELLALNFHEHFEVKPLLEHVDRRLKGNKKDRGSLRSIARRIKDRQIAMLQKESGSKGPSGKRAEVTSVFVAEQPKNEAQQRYLEMLNQGESKLYQLDELIPDFTSPDKRHKLTMVVTGAKWESQEFRLQILEGNSNTSPITATWADLPLTDNTLFPDGNRFAVVIYSVQDDGVIKNVKLKFIWFPKDYFTPRERPLDYGEFLKLVGKKVE